VQAPEPPEPEPPEPDPLLLLDDELLELDELEDDELDDELEDELDDELDDDELLELDEIDPWQLWQMSPKFTACHLAASGVYQAQTVEPAGM
jgi:hypothetical protein